MKMGLEFRMVWRRKKQGWEQMRASQRPDSRTRENTAHNNEQGAAAMKGIVCPVPQALTLDLLQRVLQRAVPISPW